MIDTFTQWIVEFIRVNFSGNLADFHFLRPSWLLLLLPALLIPYFFALKDKQDSDWKQAISAKLLPYLTTRLSPRRQQVSTGLIGLIIMLTGIALSGPTWNKVEQPVQKLKDDLVIVLDLSLSMYATDLAPNRITRVRQKVQDILTSRTEGDTGLVVYSADAHTVTPLTDDIRTIKAMLPALEPFIMPAAGSEPAKGIEKAVDLLKQSGSINGRILLITDGIEPFQIEEIAATLQGRSLQILSVGTQAGAPINLPERGYLKDGDTVIVAGNNIQHLHNLAKQVNAVISEMTLTDADLKKLQLTPNLHDNLTLDSDDAKLTSSAWQDRGYLLSLPLILLVLTAYRRRLLSLALLPLVLAATSPSPAEASTWDDLWTTRDQQAQHALNNGEAETAAQLFNNKDWKAYAKYKAAQKLDAAKMFTEQGSEKWSDKDKSDAHFNAGTAFAQTGEYEKAIESFNSALELNPTHADAATNKKIVEEIIEKQKQQDQEQDSDKNNDEQKDPNDKDDKSDKGNKDESKKGSDGDKQKDQQGKDGDSSDSDEKNGEENGKESDEQGDQKEPSGKPSDDSDPSSQNQGQNQDQDQDQKEPGQSSEVKQNEEDGKEEQSPGSALEDAEKESPNNPQGVTAASDAPPALQDEEKQAFEQWMRRVPDDPSGLLRRKFAQQYQEQEDKPNQEGRPLW